MDRKQQKELAALDDFRMVAALLVIAIHTSPLESVSAEGDFFLTRVLARMAVPFFLMVTGQFVLGPVMRGEADAYPKVLRFAKKTALLYALTSLAYLPLGIYAGYYENLDVFAALRLLVWDGTFYHLWYFPAVLLGMLLVCALLQCFSGRICLGIAAALYGLGLLGDSYWGLTQQVAWLQDGYEWLFSVFSHTRNGLFLAPLFLLLGARAGEGKQTAQRWPWLACFVVSFAGMTAEAFWLRAQGWQRHDSMYVFLPVVMLCLYRLLLTLRVQTPAAARFRAASMWIYLVHPAVIVLVRGIAKLHPALHILADHALLHYVLDRHDSMYVFLPVVMLCLYRLLLTLRVQTPAAARFRAASMWIYLVHPAVIVLVRGIAKLHPALHILADHALLHYVLVSLLSVAMGLVAAGRKGRYKKGRCWSEIDEEALAENVRALRAALPRKAALMPALKADAYGHGAVRMGRALNRLGVRAFCVACAEEGAALRRGGVRGEILILGYTHPSEWPRLRRYRLTQSIVDKAYAEELARYARRSPFRLPVHVAVDTGMHRLGLDARRPGEIVKVCRLKGLRVTGIFTHLCASQSRRAEDQAFTREQAKRLDAVLAALASAGMRRPKTHLLASGGVLNYPQLGGEYARVGIALYGVLSVRSDWNAAGIALRPVLTVKARVASVRTLRAGEGAGYDLAYVAADRRRIAAVTIGYADGLPRALGEGRGAMLVHGQRASIVGRICMDQTLIDVTQIEGVRAGDEVVVLGQSGQESISAYDLAEQSGTITNEVLSRLGSRVEKA